MAKTWLDCNPTSRLVVVEAASTLGGVWAKHRLYSGLKTNNMLGTYEYSDFPMDPSRYGVKPGEHIPGEIVHQYLRDYVEHFDIYGHIRFDCNVETVEQQADERWLVTIAGSVRSIRTTKVVVATGLTSEPSLPAFSGSSSFKTPNFHAKDLAIFPPSHFEADDKIVVLGGSKSAWDAAHTYASAGLSVDWIIRRSGRGPAWMTSAYVTPLKLWLEKLVHTRVMTWFSPCIWGNSDGFLWVRRFMHGTWLGRQIVDVFWRILRRDVENHNSYDAHPETAKLKPRVSPFWVGASKGILNYPTDIFDLIKEDKIKVHIADITHLSFETVHLSSGISLHANALVCATGWKHKPTMKFLPEGLESTLGLPVDTRPSRSPFNVVEANRVILSEFPRLAHQPELGAQCRPLSADALGADEEPYRLWRYMVPPASVESRNIAFAGMLLSISTPLIAQLQALWITAYLDGSLALRLPSRPINIAASRSKPESQSVQRMLDDRSETDLLTTTTEKAEWETVLHTQFVRWRYPAGFSSRFPDFVFDALPYMDMLLRDLELRYRRKGSLWKECLEPYGPEDYKGLVDEWQAKAGRED